MSNEAAQELDSLREHLSRLSEASTLISESLEFEAVLQGALDIARGLTGARYALIVLVNDQQVPVEFLSSGLTPEQEGQFWELSEKWELFEFLTGIEEPLRLANFQGFLKKQKLPEFNPPFPISPAVAYLSVPIRYRDTRVGTIHVAEKDTGFSTSDEETLVMFASQAALAISDARRYRQERRTRAELEALVDISPMSALVFDAKTGVITSINQEAQQVMGALGLSSDAFQEVVETGTYRRADGRVISETGLTLEQVLVSGETVRDEEMIVEFTDGQSFDVVVNATPVHSPEGAVESVVVTTQDMAPLAELERLRTEFLGMVSHELRSPLTAIKGSASTLLEGHSSIDPAEMIQYFRIIDEQADYMRDLIADLVDVVRIESGTLSVSPVALELPHLVDEARNTFLSAGGRDNVRINVAPDLPLVMADRRRIVQVVTNLLTNASHNSHDTSTIRVEATLQNLSVAVSVIDNGRGVPAERMPHLFAKFTGTDSPDQGRNLGLGLAICKGIVEAHGGRIWAESDGPGLGSRFTFTIPTSDERTPSAAPERAKAARRPQRTVNSELTRVLAVDDDPRTLKHVRDSLANAGYEPIVTGDPDEVAALIEETDPEVALLDLMLPGQDGINLMKDILAIREIPVIFLSGYDQDELITKAFEMGAVDYMVKPFSAAELAARVRAALRKKPEQPESFALGNLSVNLAERVVTVAGRHVDLTPTEYRLLAELVSNAGVALTHDHLLDQVWGPGETDDARRMRTVVKNLRQKLGDDARNPRYIVTVPHIGYRMPKAVAPQPAEA